MAEVNHVHHNVNALQCSQEGVRHGALAVEQDYAQIQRGAIGQDVQDLVEQGAIPRAMRGIQHDPLLRLRALPRVFEHVVYVKRIIDARKDEVVERWLRLNEDVMVVLLLRGPLREAFYYAQRDQNIAC